LNKTDAAFFFALMLYQVSVIAIAAVGPMVLGEYLRPTTSLVKYPLGAMLEPDIDDAVNVIFHGLGQDVALVPVTKLKCKFFALERDYKGP
jgi:hypothetical protein